MKNKNTDYLGHNQSIILTILPKYPELYYDLLIASAQYENVLNHNDGRENTHVFISQTFGHFHVSSSILLLQSLCFPK